VVWQEGEGHSVVDGGNDLFRVGGFCGVSALSIPDFCVIIIIIIIIIIMLPVVYSTQPLYELLIS
jgi:hypothetical protein